MLVVVVVVHCQQNQNKQQKRRLHTATILRYFQMLTYVEDQFCKKTQTIQLYQNINCYIVVRALSKARVQ